VGVVTSGGFGPTLGAPLVMAYLDSAHVALDSEVSAIVRGKKVPMKVSKMPFVAQRYYRG
jgi:aminomethyltransferase